MTILKGYWMPLHTSPYYYGLNYDILFIQDIVVEVSDIFQFVIHNFGKPPYTLSTFFYRYISDMSDERVDNE